MHQSSKNFLQFEDHSSTATIAGIATTATTTIIGATIITIIAIGETYRIVALSNSPPQGQGSQRTLRPFPFSDSGPMLEGNPAQVVKHTHVQLLIPTHRASHGFQFSFFDRLRS